MFLLISLEAVTAFGQGPLLALLVNRSKILHKCTSSTSRSSLEFFGGNNAGVVADKLLTVRWYTCLGRFVCVNMYLHAFSVPGAMRVTDILP